MHHVIGLSGGKDSTAMAIKLRQLQPDTDFTYIFFQGLSRTPVENETSEVR